MNFVYRFQWHLFSKCSLYWCWKVHRNRVDMRWFSWTTCVCVVYYSKLCSQFVGKKRIRGVTNKHKIIKSMHVLRSCKSNSKTNKKFIRILNIFFFLFFVLEKKLTDAEMYLFCFALHLSAASKIECEIV